MKFQSKLEMTKGTKILLIITAVFFCIMIGFFIGRITTDGTLSVHTQQSYRAERLEIDAVRPNGLVNINTADKDLLQELPGIGEATAERILQYRSKNGPFQKIEDIMNVNGIGESTFNKFKSMICVEDQI